MHIWEINQANTDTSIVQGFHLLSHLKEAVHCFNSFLKVDIDSSDNCMIYRYIQNKKLNWWISQDSINN